MGYSVCEVPISWINRTPDMGASSFKLMKVGGGYQRVLWNLWLKMFGAGPYKNLARGGGRRKTTREFQVNDAARLTPSPSGRGQG
jgi:hypothetical protein